ncbi:hypothetical protein [Shimia haliotis]|uniref:Sulfotransferase family protein n=1 Tax=Shimia haliotis TaxID=1280847 RepID=A0A1I4EGK7_9RHOB|nr:hypothetical protein [Shimia haliotis]SFL04895.1 hypothetical protein SAMN04488036_104280 [Shimia haliotis]
MTFENVILHIGRHKSGTSSLQHWLALSRGRLSEVGVLYPHTGAPNRIAHHRIAGALREKAFGDVVRLVEGIRQEQAGEDTLLLSSEAFQNLDDMDGLQYMLAHLGAQKVTVICYVREHLDYAVSAYRQMIQAQSKSPSFSKYCYRFQGMTPFFERWRSVGDLHLAWYHRDLLKNGDIIEDFCERAGLPFQERNLEDRNPSIGGNLLVYKLFSNRMKVEGLKYEALRKLALEEPSFRAPFFVPDEAAAELRAQSRYNATVEAELGAAPVRSWECHKPLPDLETLEGDFDRISVATGTKFDSDMLTKAGRSHRVFSLTPELAK